MDFMPVKVKEEYLDTGGGNYFSYYRFMDLPSLEFPSVETEQFRDGGDYHSDFLTYIDFRRWVHTINGSCWSKGSGVDETDVGIVAEIVIKYGIGVRFEQQQITFCRESLIQFL